MRNNLNSGDHLIKTKQPFSKQQIKDSFNKAAVTYDAAAIVQKEVCKRLLERLEYIKADPSVILDIGAGTGQGTMGLARQYPAADIVAMDLSENMLHLSREKSSNSQCGRQAGHPGFVKNMTGIFSSLRKSKAETNIHRVCADAEQLPLLDASVDLIFSNLTIQWCFDLTQLFQEFRRVLKPGGFLLFTTFGPDTLYELRESWAGVSDKVHVNEFADMHDIGDALYNVQAENPVMDSEKIILNYQSVKQILVDIKQVGAHNQNNGRAKGLTGKNKLQAMYRAYEKFYSAEGYPVTYEVLYGHAWNPKTPLQRTQSADQGQQTSISFAQMKSQLKSKPGS